MSSSPGKSRPATTLAVAFAMTFPTLAAGVYFLLLGQPEGQANPIQRLAYSLCKGTQFGFPIVFLVWRDGRWPRPARPSFRGLGLALGFGLATAGLILALYFGWLRGSSLMARTPLRIRAILRAAELSSPAGYLLMAGGLVIGHSLLEEYYWRWFVFGQLNQVLPRLWAVVLASLAFMAHHAIVLGVFLPGNPGLVVLFALAVATGGAVWCVLYARSKTIYPPWLSHLLVDAALFVIGWDLVARVGW